MSEFDTQLAALTAANASLQTAIGKMNNLMTASETTDVTIEGQVKPSVAKQIKTKTDSAVNALNSSVSAQNTATAALNSLMTASETTDVTIEGAPVPSVAKQLKIKTDAAVVGLNASLNSLPSSKMAVAISRNILSGSENFADLGLIKSGFYISATTGLEVSSSPPGYTIACSSAFIPVSATDKIAHNGVSYNTAGLKMFNFFDANYAFLGAAQITGAEAVVGNYYPTAKYLKFNLVGLTGAVFVATVKPAVNVSTLDVSVQTLDVSLKKMLPYWLPEPAPKLYIDFASNHFFWGGEVRSLSDLVSNGDGSYNLPSDGSWWAVNNTVILDYEHNFYAGTPAGTLFSTYSDSNTRYEISVSGVVVTLYNGVNINFQMQNPQASQVIGGKGINRVAVAVSGAGNITQANNFSAVAGTATAVNHTTFKVGCINKRARFNDSVATNTATKRLVVWDFAMTADQIGVQMTQVDTIGYPIHYLGDSFLNNHALLESTRQLTSGYTSVSQDGIGGTSITQQAARYEAAAAKWRESTLVIMDGGFDGTKEEAKAAILKMLKLIKHGRWLYIQSNPQVPLGGALRTAWDDRDAAMQAFCKQHYVPTLDRVQTYGDNSTTDNDNVALGLWPASLMSDTIHPNANGNSVLGKFIYDALSERGWL